MKDPYIDRKSLPYRFRSKRFEHVKKIISSIIENKGECRILDVGGTELYWDIGDEFINDNNISIDLLNLEFKSVGSKQFRSIIGDATDMSSIDENSYDFCHSNSVIEHVGNWENIVRASKEVARVAPNYFVQTPYFWFPYEPHFRSLFFHWLPEQIRIKKTMKKDYGFHTKKSTIDEAMKVIQNTYLLDKRQFSYLFAEATIIPEKAGFFVKSLMAIKNEFDLSP